MMVRMLILILVFFFFHFFCFVYWFHGLASELFFCTVEGHSIYIKNLPLNATAAQVEEVFSKFGTIRPGGVQVRNHKVYSFFLYEISKPSLKTLSFFIDC